MSDDLKTICYGKTTQVKLANGETYTLREPDIDMLLKVKLDVANLDDINNVKRLVLCMLQPDNPSIDAMNVGKLVTFSMLQPTSDFMKAVKEIAGLSEGNEKAG